MGSFQVTIVSDGTYEYANPRQLFFPNAPEEEICSAMQRQGLDSTTWNSYESPYPSLVVRDSRTTILIDTGAGTFGQSTGKLTENLADIGLTPSDIDIVLLTHLHPDHAGGAFCDDGSPAFPNARYMLSRTERDFWRSNPSLSRLTIPRDFQTSLEQFGASTIQSLHNVCEVVEPGDEILPGMTVLDAAGHTPGHIAIQIGTGRDCLLSLSDTLVHPLHASHPTWTTAVDFDRQKTVESRIRWMSLAASEGARIFAFHFPRLGFGRIERSTESFRWSKV